MGPIKRLRKKPMVQRSMMTEEEQLASPEQGIEEQGFIETAEDALTQGKENLPGVNTGSIGIGKIQAAAEKGAVQGLSKIKKMRDASPTFSEGVAGGKTAPGASKFANWIRGKGDELVEEVTPRAKPESLQVPRFGSNDTVKQLQQERQTLNLKTEAGRQRLKEIDHMLENRTYFGK